MRVAIIGAGVSGLVLARLISKAAKVTVFEKSRGPAGRMSTRNAPPYQFDHGAQYFTAGTRAFKDFLAPFISAGHIGLWNTYLTELDRMGQPVVNRTDIRTEIYVGIPKMNQFGKSIASGLEVHLESQVSRLEQIQKNWQLFDDNNRSLGVFEWVISAVPSPQCENLLPAGFAHMAAVRHRKMAGCYALMLGFDKALSLPWEAAKVSHPAISWICVNSSKPGRPQGYSLLVHSSNNWAERHIDDDPDVITAQLIDALVPILGRRISHPDHKALHRWRYAKTEPQTSEITLLDPQMRLGACGDWCVRSTVEGAYTSAARMAEQLNGFL